MFADRALVETAGLLAPPVFEISRELAARHPESAVKPTLSLTGLIGAVAGSRRTRI
jgi:energy-coupling factor transport system ATP-binding protein